jgi:hypothetical protein
MNFFSLTKPIKKTLLDIPSEYERDLRCAAYPGYDDVSLTAITK